MIRIISYTRNGKEFYSVEKVNSIYRHIDSYTYIEVFYNIFGQQLSRTITKDVGYCHFIAGESLSSELKSLKDAENFLQLYNNQK